LHAPIRTDSRFGEIAVGSRGIDELRSVAELPDGSLVACGGTEKVRGDTDVLWAHISGDGSLIAAASIGGTADDLASAVLLDALGRIVLIGSTSSLRPEMGADGFVSWLDQADELRCSSPFDNSEASLAFLRIVSSSDAPSFQLVERVVAQAADSTAVPTSLSISPLLECDSRQPPDELSPSGSPFPVRFTDHEVLMWEPGVFNNSDEFNIYRGRVSELRSPSYGTCFTARQSGTSADDPDLPGVDDSFFYLVLGVNPTGEGPAGWSSTGDPRLPVPRCP
jgi:hypothetical protein